MLDALAKAVLARDRRALSRAITLVESQAPAHRRQARELQRVRKVFGLRAEERVLNSWACALAASESGGARLMIGRLYLTSSSLCFLSTMLGREVRRLVGRQLRRRRRLALLIDEEGMQRRLQLVLRRRVRRRQRCEEAEAC